MLASAYQWHVLLQWKVGVLKCFVGEASAYAKYAMDCLRLAKCDSFDGCVVIIFGTF